MAFLKNNLNLISLLINNFDFRSDLDTIRIYVLKISSINFIITFTHKNYDKKLIIYIIPFLEFYQKIRSIIQI